MISVGYLNAHGQVDAVRAGFRRDPDSLGIAEASRLGSALGAGKYRAVTGQPGTRNLNARRGAGDNRVLTRRRLRSLGAGAVQLTETVHPSRIGHERWAVWSAFEKQGVRIVHLQLHLLAAPTLLNDPNAGDSRLVRKYAESVERAGFLLQLFDGLGFLPVVTGDVNLRADAGVPWSPHKMLRESGLQLYPAGVDMIGWDRRLHLAAPVEQWQANKVDGKRHTALLVELETR